MKIWSHVDSVSASDLQFSERIIRIICFLLNAWHIFFCQWLFLLNLLDLWSCTITVGAYVSSIAFCLNALQLVATEGQHIQMEGNAAVWKQSSWSCTENALIQKRGKSSKEKGHTFCHRKLASTNGLLVRTPASKPRGLMLVDLDALWALLEFIVCFYVMF